MTGKPFRIELLDSRHERQGFRCGMGALDQYFREQASQDVRRRATACFVAIEAGHGKVAGSYTLAAGGVGLTELPEAMKGLLPAIRRFP